MKNSLKNLLNLFVLLGFMFLAWATSKAFPLEPIKMEVAFNADSTGFLFKNVDSVDYNIGVAIVDRKIKGQLDTVIAAQFSLNNVSIKAKQTITLPLDKFIGFRSRTGVIDTLSKSIQLDRFKYSVNLSNKAEGFFDHKF